MASDHEIYNGTESYKHNEKFMLENGMVNIELTPFTAMFFEVK